LNWKDEVTGKNVVNKIFLRDEIYRGPHVRRAPDLQILWEDDVVLSPIRGREIFPEVALKIKQDWSGDHRLEGIFMAKGPDVTKGVALSNLSIYDVAPTILHLLNALAPNDVDGRVLREMISD
jgi:predicted AlkP superfamily phosphohydrolase/phosphomutase